MEHARNITLEVCIASVHDAVEAAEGGADRLELNSALELGGLTPSAGLLVEVKQAVSLPVIVMLRPRPAGFCYNAFELRTMYADAEHLLALGADGIAFGALTSERRIDREACRQFRQIAGARETVFHRACDVLASVPEAMDQLIELGVTRLLTSGQAATAIEGADTIAQWQRNAGDRIEILPASGIGPHNVQQLLQLTGCTQIHGSFSRPLEDDAGPVTSSTYRGTDRQLVRKIPGTCVPFEYRHSLPTPLGLPQRCI